jgi:hypothetical protein
MYSPIIANTRGLSAVIFLLFLSTMLNAQGIKIHERVEINPHTPKVQNKSTSDSSPECLTVVFTSGGGVPIRIIGGAWDGQTSEDFRVDGTDNITYTYCGSGYHGSGGCGFYFQGQYGKLNGTYDIPIHVLGTIGLRVLLDTQQVWTESGDGNDDTWIGNNTQFGINYKDLKVVVPGNVCTGDLFGIALQPVEPGNGGIPYYAPGVDLVTLSVIRGKELGGFTTSDDYTEKKESVTLYVSYPLNVNFTTSDTLPPGVIEDTVGINIKSYAIDTTFSFAVRACPRCIIASSEKSPLSIGDTTLLSIVYASTGKPVPMDKSLDISILGGTDGENGTLLVDGSTGTNFTGVTQQIRYIAPANISRDSLVVSIAASESESSGGSAASIRSKDSLKLSLKKNSTMSSRILKVLQAQGTQKECPIGSVTVKRLCIIASSEKSPLSVGDTTLLSFAYGPSGSPVPSDKSLDVSILGGTDGENGTLLVDGNTGTSFTGVTQPIKYIAPTSISGDSLVVSIAAAESESSSGGGSVSSIHQKDSLKLSPKKNNTMSLRIQKVLQVQGTLAVCPIGSMTIENNCGNPPCGDPPTVNVLPPRDVSNLPPPQGVCDTKSTLGWTTPLNGGQIFPNNTLNNLFSVQVCANRNEKQWKFNLTTVGFLYQTGICQSNLIGKTDIGDGTGPNVNAANYCKILEWLNTINPNTNQPYPGKYYSSNILQLHESFHLNNLVTQFETYYLQTFLRDVNSSSVPITDCSESAQSVIDRNKNKLEEDFKKLMKAFVESIDDKYMKDDEAKVQKDTKTYFEGLANIIKARAINESWPTCK